MSKVLEVCVDNLESAIAAIEGGASRLELSSSLIDGGLTPSPGLLEEIQVVARERKVPVFCMLRCRAGDFVYNEGEMNVMKRDAKILRKFGADGFVFGALTNKYEVDMKSCREIILQCSPLPVTFHRAFDFVRRPTIEIEVLIDLGFKRVLTSGKQKNAQLGVKLIKKLVDQVGNRLIIMPGAGINKQNIGFIVENSGANEFHGSFKKLKENDEIAEEDEKNFEEIMEAERKSIFVLDKNQLAEVLYILNNVNSAS